jgi:dolichyl-phosphate-mannose--protein O-mannosyl transferase
MKKTSVKMVGLFLVALIGIAVIYDLWGLLDIKRGLTMVYKNKTKTKLHLN